MVERVRRSLVPVESPAQLRALEFSAPFASIPSQPSPPSSPSRLRLRRMQSLPSLMFLRLLRSGATVVAGRNDFKPKFFCRAFFGCVISKQSQTSYHVVEVLVRLWGGAAGSARHT